jgi:hypothetical protein
MHREQVHRLLGPPESSIPIWNGSGVCEHYEQARYNVGYDNAGAVNHVGVCPGGAALGIRGRPLWTLEEQPDPNPALLALDPEPVEWVGIWYFLRLGVATTGYHDDDPCQRAVTVFPSGAKAEILPNATPADTRRYLTR